MYSTSSSHSVDNAIGIAFGFLTSLLRLIIMKVVQPSYDIHFFFDAPPGVEPGRRLNFRGSKPISTYWTTVLVSHTFATHQNPVPSTLSSLPESATGLAHKNRTAYSTILGSIDLLPRAKTTRTKSEVSGSTCLGSLPNHAIRMLIRVVFSCVVASGTIIVNNLRLEDLMSAWTYLSQGNTLAQQLNLNQR